MPDQSKLLDAAEKVILLFHDVVNNVTGDQMSAAKSLIQMTVAINELAEEVNKGKQLLAQLSQLKQQFEGQAEQLAKTISEEKPEPQTQTNKPTQPNVDPTQLVAKILSGLNLPDNLVPETKKPRQ